MPYITPTLTQIRSDLLRDIRNQLPDADVSVDSDYYVRATSVASAVEGLYQHQAWIVRQIFPDEADTDYLERHAAIRGLARKPAVAAAGQIRIAGTPGAVIPEGQVALAANGQRFIVQNAGTIEAGGTATLPIAAQEKGPAGNAAENTPVQLQAVPAGLQLDAMLLSMLGGVERETDGELLARLLDVIRRPPAGGNRHDYRRWALEVPGVTGAYVFPLRRGLGTVDVIIVAGGGLPSAATLDAVRDHIDSTRPVTAKDCVVSAPEIQLVDLHVLVSLSGVPLDEALPAISDAALSHFGGLEPGQAWVRSQSEALISSVPGVIDRRVVTPVNNVAATVTETTVEWLRMGALVVEPMP